MSNPGPHGIQPAYRRLRDRAISQREAAVHSGVSVGSMSAILTGHRGASERVRDALAALLDIPGDDLFTLGDQ
jgi:transcriptional regulator with XRE-family HTH domain